jgi:hypothetical protein
MDERGDKFELGNEGYCQGVSTGEMLLAKQK